MKLFVFSSKALFTSLIAFAIVSLPTQVLAAEDPFQAVFHGSGCGDPIKISAVLTSGQVGSERTVVKGKPGYLLSAKAVSTDSKHFLFTSWNCTTKTFSLYQQNIGKKPTAKLLMALPADWWMVGVTWDIARGAPAVLVQNPDYEYQIQALLPSGWTPLWTGDRSSFGGRFPSDLQSRSGYEYLVIADDLGATWGMYRVSTSGSYSGYMGEVLAGPGEIHSIADNFTRNTTIFIGPDGSWICDWSASGTVQAAISQGKCVTVPGGASYYGVGVLGKGGNQWLLLDPTMSLPSRTEFKCVGGNFISCGTPVVGKRGTTSLRGNDFAYVYLGNSVKFVKTKFKNLGSSRI